MWFHQWKLAGCRWCKTTVRKILNCLKHFVVLSEEERLFQEYQFESTRQICLIACSCFSLLRLCQYATEDYKQVKLRDIGDQESWEFSLLKHFRLVQFSANAIFGITCIASSSRFPRLRSAICSHASVLWYAIILFTLFSNHLFALMLDRQIAWSAVDRCDASHIRIACPSVTWALTAVSGRIALMYGLNFFFFFIPFRHTMALYIFYTASLFCMVIPFEPLKDQIWTTESFDPSVIFGLVQCITHIFVSIWYANNYANEVQKAFKSSKRIYRTKGKTQRVLGTLIPDRVLSLINFTLDSAPELFCEEFPMVTVLFCSFNKKDVLNMTSASEFFQHLSDIIGEFDKIVDEAGLYKVEHIGEDYVVASSIIQTGLTSTSIDMHNEYTIAAVKIVEVALALVKFGNASAGCQIPVDSELDKSSSLLSKPLLHFSAGIHSGPLIGAIAGKTRRFYRLFGDTVNTAARMRHHASEGSVQISTETQKLVAISDAFQLVEHAPKYIKGKGQMTTFTVLPNTKPETHVAPNQSNCDINRISFLRFQLDDNTLLSQREVESPSDDMTRDTHIHSSSIMRDVSFGQQPSDIGQASLHEIFSGVEGNSNPLGGLLVEDRHTTDRKVKIESTLAHPTAVINIQQRSLVLSNTFVCHQDEERLTFWFDSLKKVSKELGLFSGKFRNARIEEEYSKAVMDVKLEDLKTQLLLTVFVHLAFFSAIFPVLRHSEPNFGERGSIVVGSGGFLLLFHLGLWFVMHLRPHQPAPFSLVLSPTVSAITMLLLFGCSNSPFTLLGIIIAIVMRHPYETPLLYLCLSTIMVLCSAVMYLFITGHVTVFGLLFATMTVFSSILVIGTLFRVLHCRALRSTWKLSVMVEHQSRLLDQIMEDLMPSHRAKRFLEKRYSIMARPMGDHILEKKEYFYSSSYCIDWSSKACVLQSDLVGFTPLCQSLKPRKVVALLHELWCIADSTFEQCKQTCQASCLPVPLEDCIDEVEQRYRSSIGLGLTSAPFKMDTIGDAYIVIAKLPDSSYETKSRVVSELMGIASAIMNAIHTFSSEQAPKLLGIAPGAVKLRMGMALGDAVSGVVGYLQPRYHVFGNVVQNAAHVESLSTPGCLRVDENIQEMFRDLMESEDNPTFSLIKSLDCSHPYLELPLKKLDSDVSMRDGKATAGPLLIHTREGVTILSDAAT